MPRNQKLPSIPDDWICLQTLASLSSKDVDIYTESEKDDASRRKWEFYTPIIEVDLCAEGH